MATADTRRAGTGTRPTRLRPADVHDRRGRGWLGGVASPVEHVPLVERARPRTPQAVSPVSQRGHCALDTGHTVPHDHTREVSSTVLAGGAPVPLSPRTRLLV